MNRMPQSLLLILVMVMFQATVKGRTIDSSLSKLLSAASKHKAYQPVGFEELQRAESLFVKTLTCAEADDKLAMSWEQLGWRFEQLRSDKEHQDVWILREQDNAVRGRGFFVFRKGTNAIYLQSPHSFYDKHTRRITLELFQRGSVSAAGWNTVRRSVQDAAHSRGNYINAFTRAILQAESRHVIVQLHGFDPTKRSTSSGRKSQIIVSNGTQYPGRTVRVVFRQLNKTTLDSVKLYPSQVEELGGTKNEQARIVHQHGFDSFVHIEMAGDIRHKLRKSRDLRDRLHAALISSFSAIHDDRTLRP